MTETNYPIVTNEPVHQTAVDEWERVFYADRTMIRNIYIQQKPTCFMVIGDPSTGKTSLAKKLVKEMRSTEIIEKNMSENTLLGKYCAEQLLSGSNLADKTLVTLIKGSISSPECQHYGYVMDGFPTYLSYDEQLRLVENLPLKPDYIIHIEIPDEDLRRRLESQRVDPIDGTLYNYYNLEDPPGPFINRTPLEVPRPNAEEMFEEVKLPKMNDIMMEEAGIEEIYGEEKTKPWHPDFPRPTKEVISRLLLRPEDSPREIDRLFNLSNNVKKSLKQFYEKFPRTHIIQIDGNLPPTQMFHNLMVIIRALSIRPAIPPYPLSIKKEDEEEVEDEGEEREKRTDDTEEEVGNEEVSEAETKGDETQWDEVVASLSVTKMPTEHSRWQLSEWQRFCPVQLREGILEYGKTPFACGFLGSLYFLSCREALDAFMRNPRPYLDARESQPKLTVKLAIIGYRKSGSATFCRLLADHYGATCISLTELLREELDAKINDTLLKVKTEVETTTMEKLNNQRKREIEEITTNNYVDNALSTLTTSAVNQLAEELLESIIASKVADDKSGEKKFKAQGLKEAITPDHPKVTEAVTRALKFAKAQPIYLEPARYVDMLETELERLDNANRNIAPSKRRPLSWVIEGLPPLEEVWQELRKRSRAVAREVKSRRHNYETLRKLGRVMRQRNISGEKRDEEDDDTTEEALMEGEGEGGKIETIKMSIKPEGPANPYVSILDPRLMKARERANEAATRDLSPDPMPFFVFKLKDDLQDYALMIHRLYAVGFGPLEGLPALPKADSMDLGAIEPMLTGRNTEPEMSRGKSETLQEEDDAVTEPPEDPPTSGQTFYPMPQPGPEVDCVRDQLINFDNAWEVSKQILLETFTAYGFPVHVQDLRIHKEKALDDLLTEVDNHLKKLFAFPVNKSSQEMLDGDAEAETEGFANTGGLEDNPALVDSDEEEMDERREEETEGEEESEEVEVADEENEEESEEAMEEEDASRVSSRNLGRTSYYCPVAYRDYHILKPGDPELVVTYKGLSYYLGNEADLNKFLHDPERYVDSNYQPPLKPPPLRIVFLGPPGTGKTLHGRQIARQFDLIHVSFEQMLQDVMVQKLKHRIGPQYNDDKVIPVIVMPDLEAAVARALWELKNPDTGTHTGEDEISVPKGDLLEEGETHAEEDVLSLHELAIREYLENDEALPDTSLNLLLPRLWQEEPYRSKGIILEGFPRSADDLTYMLESNLYFDFAVVMNAEAEDVVPRLLPARLAKWKAKMSKIEANRRIAAEWKTRKRERIKEERRKMILQALTDKRMMRLSSGDALIEAEDTEMETDAEANISQMLEEELPEDEENMEIGEEETEADAINRIEEHINDRVEFSNANAEELIESLMESKIPHFSIRADDQLTRVRYRLVKKIKNYILNREAIFERIYPITLEDAENLVASGFKHFSPFGRFCPVSWSRITAARLPPLNPTPILRYSRLNSKILEPKLGDEIDQLVRSKKSKRFSSAAVKTCCAVFRECVYWFNSETERKVFINNPIAVIRSAGDHARNLSHQPLQMAVLGGPSSERAFISKRLANELHLPCVTKEMAVQWLLTCVSQSWTTLARQIREAIVSGKAISDYLVTSALKVALLAPHIQSRGSIEVSWFDNWNNQEPPDCPFLRVWLNIRARRGRSLGIGLGGLGNDAGALTGAGAEEGVIGGGIGRRSPGGVEEREAEGGGYGVGHESDVFGGLERDDGADISEFSGRNRRGRDRFRDGKTISDNEKDADELSYNRKRRDEKIGSGHGWDDDAAGRGQSGIRRRKTGERDDHDGDSDEGGDSSRGRGYRRGGGKGRERTGSSSDDSKKEGKRGRKKQKKGSRGRRKSWSTLSDEEDGSHLGSRRRHGRRRSHGSDYSEDSKQHGRNTGRRKHRRGQYDDSDDDEMEDGGSGNSDESDSAKERRRRRLGKIDHSLEERYGIPKAEIDPLPGDILKHFAYAEAEADRRKWHGAMNGLTSDIPAEENSLIALKKAYLLSTHRMAHLMEGQANKKQDKALSISEMGLTMRQFQKKIGEFGNYCPVRLAENNELFDCMEEQKAPLVTRLPGVEGSLPNACYKFAFDYTALEYALDEPELDLNPRIATQLRFAVEYKDKTYITAGPEELKKFMANPEKYLPPQAGNRLPDNRDLPLKLPRETLSRDSFPCRISLRGFCPVCFQRSGQHYEGLRPGDRSILASYQGAYYAFCSEDCRTEFMHRPSMFCNLKPPNKLPPTKVPIQLDEIPLPGYLEQTVSYVLRSALAMCSRFRPKYPFLTLERSAIIYVALNLKALNPRIPEYLRRRAQKRVERFEQGCRLIDHLAVTMPMDNLPTRQRPECLSKELQQFLALQDKVDNEGRWIESLRDGGI